jgi:hypothetical protein
VDCSQVVFLRTGALAALQPDLTMIGDLTPVLDSCVVSEALALRYSNSLFVHMVAGI